jgi:RNA polymerase sigma-70 factor (ECF subfamily)
MRYGDAAAEAGWLEQACRGDDEAFARLVEAYQVPVYNLCFRILGDAAEAEDASQETFLRAYRNLASYDPQRKLSSWMLSIASHHCIDRLRRRRLVSLPLEDLSPSEDPRDPGPGPEARLADSERQLAVRSLLGRLAPQDRAAIVLRYWYDLPVEEIADTLGLTVSAVKSRLHRARRTMAEAWGDLPGQAVPIPGGRQYEPSTL